MEIKKSVGAFSNTDFLVLNIGVLLRGLVCETNMRSPTEGAQREGGRKKEGEENQPQGQCVGK